MTLCILGPRIVEERA